MWVDPDNREEATFKGYTVVDPATVITTHLTELIRDNMSELLSYVETQNLLDELPNEHQKLIGEVVPTKYQWVVFNAFCRTYLMKGFQYVTFQLF